MNVIDSKPSDFVYLNSLDGFEFERLCALVFDRLGYGRVENVPDVADEGRDLIIHTPQATKIVVECKHYPSGTIGRPAVQKVHSAAITEGATKAILVTTGKFSAGAIAYARKSRPQVELIDLNLLRDLTERAGIHLVTREHKVPVSYFPVSDSIQVGMILISSVSKRIASHPLPPIKLLQVYESRLRLRPVYHLRYSVHQDFETSVGVIYSIHTDNEEVLLDGVNGARVDEGVRGFLQGTPTVAGDKIAEFVGHVERGSFKIDQTTLARNAKQVIADRHSKTISYLGRNNVLYKATCRLGDRSIFIRDVRQVFIPEWSLSLLALCKRYSVNLVEKPEAVQVISGDISTCKICRQEIIGEMLLCNSCGNIVHKGRPHGYTCKACNKSLCRNCTYWTRRWLIFKDFLCQECASQKQRLEGKSMRHLAPDLPQKHCIHCGTEIHDDAIRCVKCWNMQ